MLLAMTVSEVLYEYLRLGELIFVSMSKNIGHIFYRLCQRIRNLGSRSISVQRLTDMRLAQLAESCDEYLSKHNICSSVRILRPTPFNLSRTWWAHDGIWSAALRLRGAEIIPTMCARIQSDECMFWSGEWQGSDKPGFRERRETYCKRCVQYDTNMWGIWGLRPLRLSSFVTESEVREVKVEVAKWMSGNWQKITWKGFPAGYEAWKATVNNALQADISDSWRERAESMAYHHLLNIRLLYLAYQRIFDAISPDRVFGNGGFYYQWGIVHHIAMQRNIPYFRYHKIGLNPLAWNYARNNLNLIEVSPAWKSWLKQPWSYEQEQRVEEDLTARGLCVDYRSKSEESYQAIYQSLGLDPQKPIALASTGVAWDATSNVPSPAFGQMYEWLIETIRWFADHPNWQLVIRVHPGESIVPNIASQSRTRLKTELKIKRIKLPDNVLIVPEEHHFSTYDLVPIATLGILYTSTTGLEMACTGLPVVVVGPAHFRSKGFTFDPNTREEYFAILSKILSEKVVHHLDERHELLAKRYWYLYGFHNSVVTGLLELYKRGVKNSKDPVKNVDLPQIPKELTCSDLLPGKNRYLDYICDAVINDLPIMGKNRWPPESIY